MRSNEHIFTPFESVKNVLDQIRRPKINYRRGAKTDVPVVVCKTQSVLSRYSTFNSGFCSFIVGEYTIQFLFDRVANMAALLQTSEKGDTS